MPRNYFHHGENFFVPVKELSTPQPHGKVLHSKTASSIRKKKKKKEGSAKKRGSSNGVEI